MSTLRLISTLRSPLLINKCCRILFSFSQLSFQSVLPINMYSNVQERTQQICLFSSSTIVYNRRRDTINSNVTEEFDDEEETENEENNETDQDEQEKIRNRIQQYKLPKGYRIIIRHLASLRLDLICSAGTGIGRSAIEDEFYGSKLRVNGEKSTKKAQQVKEGDIIDLVVSRTEGAKYNSKRIIVYKVFDEKSLKNKVKVCLIAWRQAIEVDGSQWS
ncbi:unnamed protein product [Rotaria sordida]|uniref:Mitochondrial transcription rescue factor 1 C-terminal domain-containing protein n=1 Tax=Rotaria sordida TaxID=392033 RepID=A0A813VGH7_9BILA|nr:unnamed protein product [Rotaria sordida]CAF0860755.1 unnamed protein product [Rotaria sordida]CAF0929349.1 unnamed protein product [Rotaria sordida]CAF3638263.1 unnamed protein product [Rotaria sordida]CAF3981933.1 unnamed protein product [Rotaria sordida]